MLSVLMVVLSTTPDDCREAYAAVHYREAAQLCVEVVPTAPPGELAGLYRLAGLSLAALGEDERAFQVFSSLLALEPKLELDASISPRLRAPFDRARAARAGAAVVLRPTPVKPLKENEPVALDIAVDDGPGHPVQRLQVNGPQGSTTAARADPTSVQLPPAPAGPLTLELNGYDVFGGRVASVSSRFEVTGRAPERPLLASWKVWTAVGAVVLAGALVCGVSSRVLGTSAQQQHFDSDRVAEGQLAGDLAITADVGFAVGGVAALLALILGVTAP